MHHLTKKIVFGDLELCKSEGRVIHACKHPCFQLIAGQPKPTASNYLHVENGRHLYLNVVDPKVPLFRAETFYLAMDFAKADKGGLTVHCNMGKSRSPVIAMLAAIARGELKSLPWGDTRKVLEVEHQAYIGDGLNAYMDVNWHAMVKYAQK